MALTSKRPSHIPDFPRKMTPALVGLEIGFALALLIAQLLGLKFDFEGQPLIWFGHVGWQIPITLCAIVVPTWALISERRAPRCFNYIALIVLYAISFVYFNILGGVFVQSGILMCTVMGILSNLQGTICLVHLIIVSVYVARHRKKGGHSKPSKEIEVVKTRELEVVRVMSTDRSSDGPSSRPDIAHYPPDGINPLRMNPGDEGTPNALSPTNNTRAIPMSDMLRPGSLKSSQDQLQTKLPETALPVSRQPNESVFSELESSSDGEGNDSIV